MRPGTQTVEKPETGRDIKTLVTGLQTWPQRKLITNEGRISLSEADFVKYHQLMFPGAAIPKLITPWYNPEFARIVYIEAHRRLPLLTTNIRN